MKIVFDESGFHEFVLYPKGGARRVGAQNFAFFFPLPPQFSFFFLSLGVFALNFGGVWSAGLK